MDLSNQIMHFRKSNHITQEALAQQLDVTNQAVSKWESGQCCPDVMLLPKLADIFGISLDALFGRVCGTAPRIDKLPWPDDNTLRVVLYTGHTLVGNSSDREDLTFTYEGPALNIESHISVSCGEVAGSVKAGTCISCGNVAGNVDAGTHVSCGNVEGNIDAGANVNCGNVSGDIDAGANIKCGCVSGNASAGCFIDCNR